jgi:colanic acid/amylovoran biosynthesis glycosyltransferase
MVALTRHPAERRLARSDGMRTGDQRILYVVSLFPCWSETFIVREIDELVRRGVDVRILSLRHPSEKLVQTDAQALLGRVSYPPKGGALLWRALREVLSAPLTSLRELAELSAGLLRDPLAWLKSLAVWLRTLGSLPDIRRLRVQHIHAHWATYPSTAAMWMSGRLDVRFSFTAHAHDIFVNNQLVKRKLDRAAFGVTISSFNRHYLADRISPRAHEVLRIVHCGVPTQRLRYEPQGRIAGRILSVGRLDPIKGFEHLIDACALLAEQGVDFDCHILGDGPLRAALEQRVHRLGLAGRISLKGACPQEQVQAAMRQASVFALACVVTPQGDRDGIPVALMEAMASGVPVVSTTVSGIPELVIDGVTGRLASPADAVALARCLALQLADTAQARQMAHAARAHVEREFDVSVETGKLHAAFS